MSNKTVADFIEKLKTDERFTKLLEAAFEVENGRASILKKEGFSFSSDQLSSINLFEKFNENGLSVLPILLSSHEESFCKESWWKKWLKKWRS